MSYDTNIGGLVEGLRFPPLISREKTADSRQSLRKGLKATLHLLVHKHVRVYDLQDRCV